MNNARLLAAFGEDARRWKRPCTRLGLRCLSEYTTASGRTDTSLVSRTAAPGATYAFNLGPLSAASVSFVSPP
jgi:hypothetical protein